MPTLDLSAVAEPWSHSVEGGRDGSLTLTGNSRTYLFVGEHLSTFDLRGKTLRFTVDVHDVPCSVNAALYFVASRTLKRHAVDDYCDMQTKPTPCAEVCGHALRFTVHRQPPPSPYYPHHCTTLPSPSPAHHDHLTC